jgi:hypothetical protein
VIILCGFLPLVFWASIRPNSSDDNHLPKTSSLPLVLQPQEFRTFKADPENPDMHFVDLNALDEDKGSKERGDFTAYNNPYAHEVVSTDCIQPALMPHVRPSTICRMIGN